MTSRPAWALPLWIAMYVAITIGSLLPAHDLPSPVFEGMDKVEHALGYAVLAAYGTWLYPTRWLRVLVTVIVFGIAIEIAQGLFTTSRSADPLDALADAIGAALAQAAWRASRHRAEPSP
ncbi:VanZ family protein [Lysobacter sp. HA18]